MSPAEKRPSLTPSFPLSSKRTSKVITFAESPAPHRGWHSRGYLPHWDHPGTIQSANFRLNDSLPAEVVARMKREIDLLPEKKKNAELRRRMEEYLDAGQGACWLRRPEISNLVQNALLHFDGDRYRLLAWCIMPNHVHTLIETHEGFPLGEVLHSWKSFTGHEANKIVGRNGEFWQRDYFDRYVRNAEHYEKVVAYLRKIR